MHLSRALTLQRDQVWILIAKDFKLKYGATLLGCFWTLLVPMFTSLVYYFVFGVMMRWSAENYLLYLVSGTFLWQFFANVILTNGTVLTANEGLLKKTSFDRSLLVRGTFYIELIHLVLTLPVLCVMMYCYGVKPDWPTVVPNLIVCLTSVFLMSVGISYAYAACNLYFRDLERIVNIVMMMWMFGSPVFIPVSNVPACYQWLYTYNPAAMMLNIWRDVFYAPGWHPTLYVQTLGIGVGVFVLGRLMFRRMERGFAEMM